VLRSFPAPVVIVCTAACIEDRSGAQDRSRAAGVGGAIGLLLGGVLTEYNSWRWCLYVNLVFAAAAIIGVLILIPHVPADRSRHLDLRGAVASGAGLFRMVYGFSHAQITAWGNPLTLALLCAGVVLLIGFGLLQRATNGPLLPLRVMADRNRGGAQLGLLIAGAGMFGIFLFLSYYQSQTLHFTPVQTGLGFLPLVGAIALTAGVASTDCCRAWDRNRWSRWACCSPPADCSSCPG